MILYVIRPRAGSDNDDHVIVTLANDREEAKRIAFQTLLGNKDQYTVEPVTREQDIVHLVHSDKHTAIWLNLT